MILFHVTYDIVTPESAEHGDAAERGFYHGGGYKRIVPDDMYGAPAGKLKDACSMRLRQAMDLIASCVEDCGFWFAEVDGRDNYQTGATETRSLHPPENITAASYRRLRRLLAAS